MSQATKVGADVVLYGCQYLGSQQTAMPWIQYNPGQSYTTTSSGIVNANTYGSGGNAYGTANYYGSSTTTTPGSFSTQMIPITVQRYQYDAAFFRKARPPVIGLSVTSLPSEVRERLQRNTGAVVDIVRNDSPAFKANILERDVLLRINGEEVSSPQDFIAKCKRFAGQSIDIEIWRNGETKTIPVQLNPEWQPVATPTRSDK